MCQEPNLGVIRKTGGFFGQIFSGFAVKMDLGTGCKNFLCGNLTQPTPFSEAPRVQWCTQIMCQVSHLGVIHKTGGFLGIFFVRFGVKMDLGTGSSKIFAQYLARQTPFSEAPRV